MVNGSMLLMTMNRAKSHMEEEERVIHLLVSLPKSYDMLVTALEASTEVARLDNVIERQLHEERKTRQNSKDDHINKSIKALYKNGYQKQGNQGQNLNNNGQKCYNFDKRGIQREIVQN